LTCKDDPAAWQRKLENAHEQLSRLPARDVPGSTAAEHHPGTDENFWSSWGQESLGTLTGAAFDPADLNSSGIRPEEGEAKLRRTPPDPNRQAVTYRPSTFNEAPAIAEHLRGGAPVIVDLTRVADSDAKRLFDFSAGLAIGLGGSIDRVSTEVLVLYPASVTIQARDQVMADAHRLQEPKHSSCVNGCPGHQNRRTILQSPSRSLVSAEAASMP
jgi:hypothetical protein